MKLYAVLLGGSSGDGRLAEDHETVFVAAESEREAKQAAKAKWSGAGRPHTDALVILDVVDGYEVALSPSEAAGEASFVSYNDDPYDEG